jgi:hypothetical protein
MLPEMPSTMLGHERPPRRARPDDPGQPGAGDAGRRSDAARSAARPDTDTGGAVIDTPKVRHAILKPADIHSVGPARADTYTTTFADTSGPYDSTYTVTVTDCACSRDTGTVCPAHTGHTVSDAGSAALNPDSDPAT